MPSADGDVENGEATTPTRRSGPGHDLGFKSRRRLGYAEEPTLRAGPCLGDVAEWLKAVDRELHAAALTREYNYYLLTFETPRGFEVTLLLLASEECMRVRGVAVRACGPRVEALKPLAGRPEFVVVDVEGDCVTLRAPADSLYRVLRALELAGLEGGSELVGLEPVEDLVGVEEEWFSAHQGLG